MKTASAQFHQGSSLLLFPQLHHQNPEMLASTTSTAKIDTKTPVFVSLNNCTYLYWQERVSSLNSIVARTNGHERHNLRG
jgi:hypothetical protein